ncbi:MAG: nucleotidyltransferase family protein [Kiritimatiellia bacterium]|nr:nucleotidyltransferase family protein [Kiritimatiellia bacterium]
MSTKELLREKKGEIKQIAARHGAYNLRVFGSVARGEDNSQSDIDLLVDVGPETSSWFPAGLISDLESLLGKRVEVVTDAALYKGIRNAVLSEAEQL